MRAVVPWWSGDGHRQRQCAHHRPWSSASVKNFHRSLIPLPSLRLISVALPFPLPLSSPILHTSLHLEDSPSSRKKTDTSRRKSESYFPGCSFSKLLFFLASSSSSSYLASPARSKLQEDKERGGRGRGGLDSLCGVGGSRVARMADVSWESCFRNAARIVSHPWNGGRGGVEWKRKRGDTMPCIKPVHHLLRVELVCSIECVLLYIWWNEYDGKGNIEERRFLDFEDMKIENYLQYLFLRNIDRL